MQATPPSAAVVLGETPKTKKPPEATRLVKGVAFLDFESRLQVKNESNAFDASGAETRFTMRPRNGFTGPHRWVYRRRPKLADIVFTSCDSWKG